MNANLPKTIAEAIALLSAGAGPIVAGGTDLMVKRRRWSGLAPAIPESAVFVAGIEALKYVKKHRDAIEIGAATPLATILDDPRVPALLAAALAETASPAIRHMATLGGNLANASPAADPALALVALSAVVNLEGVLGKRSVPAAKFATGPGRNVLAPAELITSVTIPLVKNQSISFVKAGGRKADAIAKVSFAGAAQIVKGRIVRFAAAFGAVGPVILRNETIEASVVGLTPAEAQAKLPELLAAYDPLIVPIDDQRSTAHYRKTVAKNLLADFVTKL